MSIIGGDELATYLRSEFIANEKTVFNLDGSDCLVHHARVTGVRLHLRELLGMNGPKLLRLLTAHTLVVNIPRVRIQVTYLAISLNKF